MKKAVLVTGAFSYIGAAVAEELLRRGHQVRTLTRRQAPATEPGRIPSWPLRFDPESLAAAMTGNDVFINTYWIRFPHAGQTFDTAVANSRLLFEAARRAGVRRVVHVSVSNPDRGLDLGYYKGKHDVERILAATGVSYAVVRPTLVVGPGDVLTNNIAWLLRRLPVFALPQGGRCRLQPVTLRDTARIVCDAMDGAEGATVDAAGPEVLTFSDFVRRLAGLVGARPLFVPVPNAVALACLAPLGAALRDKVLTREEIIGLERELLVSRQPPTSAESVWRWLGSNAGCLGRSYVNDLDRHFGPGRESPISGPSRP